MKWIATATLLIALSGGVLAAGLDDDYLAIFNQIQQADALQEGRQYPAAAARYLEAYQALQKMHADHPNSNAAAVSYRLEYVARMLGNLASYLPSTNGVPAAIKPVALTPQQQAAIWQEQIRDLTNANAQLQMKLKEALSVQPAAAAPGELDKAREKIIALEKERALLSVALEQQKAAAAGGASPSASSPDSAKLAAELAALKTHSAEADKSAQTEIAGLKQKLDESQRKLSDSAAELNNLKSHPQAAGPGADNLGQLTAERDQLKKELAAVSKELADRDAHATVGPANADAAAAKLKEVEKERDDLKKQLAAAPAAGSSAELERLRARLAALEAAPVPYTAEELAVLNASPSARSSVPPVAVRESSPKVHSAKDLPPGAGTIMQQAHLDVMAGRYDDAEKKFAEVLQQDTNNIYVLFNLGSAEFAAGRLDDCEKNVRRALALDANDPGNLYLLGILRYRQEKLDDALDALSRSAALNSTNASTQNYLGCVLADKGLRPQAETAFRKAMTIDPGYADAHFNLALVYAADNSSTNLACYEYRTALDLGHEKNEKLEKLLPAEK